MRMLPEEGSKLAEEIADELKLAVSISASSPVV
jgi:hypothetical protein